MLLRKRFGKNQRGDSTRSLFYLSLPESSLDGAASNASPLNCTVVNCEGFKRLMPPTETWNVAATEHFLMSPTPHAHATLSRMLFNGSYRVQFRELATTAILLGPPWNIKSGNNIVRTWNGECTRIGSMSLLQTSLPVPALLFGTCASLSIELHFLHCTVRWAVWKAFHSVL